MTIPAHFCAAVCAALACSLCAAQVPGEDPIILKGRIGVQMQAMPAPPKSGDIDTMTDLPAWMRAKVTRYSAKAFAADNKGIATDNDVVTTSAAQGLRKTCVQEVGSNTQSGASPGSKYGPQQKDQIVVLRGDLVNVCN